MANTGTGVRGHGHGSTACELFGLSRVGNTGSRVRSKEGRRVGYFVSGAGTGPFEQVIRKPRMGAAARNGSSRPSPDSGFCCANGRARGRWP